MILIADGGATKTDWALVGGKAEQKRFTTRGMNPFNVSASTMRAEIENYILPNAPKEDVQHIYIYASGCSAKVKQQEVIDWFTPYYPDAAIQVEGDLLGAARATCGRSAAIAGILGTGSNSCLYDGERIVENVPSLGYVLCDEGAGTNIGKILLRDYLRGRMSDEMQQEFARRYKGEESDFLNKLYKEEAPNYYLASFARFAMENQTNDYCREVITQAFNAFFAHQVTTYTDYSRYKLNLVGSIAHLAQQILKDVASEHGVEVGRIIRAPLDELVNYHLQK